MKICDVCSVPSEGRVIPAMEVQAAVVARRFDPFRLGLARGSADRSPDENFAFWSRMVRENQTPWHLCEDCLRAFRGAQDVTRSAPEPMEWPVLLHDLRLRHPLPPAPAVPPNWSPGFFSALFGRGKAWGPVDDAVLLLRHGRTAEGRELLARHVAASNELRPRLLLAFSLARSGPDPAHKLGPLATALPQPEKAALDSIVALNAGDADWLGRSVLEAASRPAATPEGAFLQLCSVVAGGDLWLQTQILHPRGRTVESAIVTKLLKAVSLLLIGDHDEAWGWIRDAIDFPASVIETYMKVLKVSLEPKEADRLADHARTQGWILRGLLLYDLGFEPERRAAFATVGPSLQPALAEACRLLS